MRFGSLFAGIGGLDLGLERAGMECAWQVEWDEFCQKVLTKHWPDVPKHGDIKDVGKHNLETVDLICGGFPCQPFSVAGKQQGTEDDRHLWPEMLRVISELKPTWVIGENVPGIIPIFLDQAIADLEAEGYTCEPFVLPACAFDALHRRDRLFIVGYSEHNGHLTAEVTGSIAQGSNGSKAGAHTTSELAGPGEQQSDVADTARGRCKQHHPKERGISVPNPDGDGVYYYVWAVEPNVGRVAHGVPNRVDRLRSLGNAVVPQVAEHIGRMIMEAL